MNEMSKVIMAAQITLLEKLCYIGDIDKDGLYSKLEVCVKEMMDAELHMEEREFAMERAVSIMNILKEYYIEEI